MISNVNDLSEAEAQTELARLATEIRLHDIAYYQHDTPQISDADYDTLKQRHLALAITCASLFVKILLYCLVHLHFPTLLDEFVF